MLGYWFLESSVLADLQAARDKFPVDPAVGIGAFGGGESRPSDRIYRVVGDVAQIEVSGVLTMRPSWIALIFGGGNTTYPAIQDAIARAEDDKAVKRIEVHLDTPGGQVTGLYETMGSLAGAEKPTTAIVGSMAASGGYMLASQADTIVASSRASTVGSIGVRADFWVSEEVVTITNRKSPRKAPNVSTESGKEMVQDDLDAIHDLFAGGIATGRNVSLATVNSKFGQGGMYLAEEAERRGMIDSVGISTGASASTEAAPEAAETEESEKMTLAELQAKHPELYQSIVDAATKDERDRVTAHLTLGNASGDMETALKAVEDGDEMTATLQAKYMAAGMNRKDAKTRAGEDNPAGDNAAGTEAEEEAQAAADEETVSLVEQGCTFTA